jgi:hypothetical protein
MTVDRIDPEVVEAAEEAWRAVGPSAKGVPMEAAIRAADRARGLRVEKEGRTTYKDNKFVGRWRLVTDWIEVRDA